MDSLQNHQHSLETLNILQQYTDWIKNIQNVAVMGAGAGLDALWWAQLTDPDGTSLDINVTAVEINPDVNKMIGHPKIKWMYSDFNSVEMTAQDLIWCHDSFQFTLDPMGTLLHWYNLLRPDGMLCMQVPYSLGVNKANNLDKVNYVVNPGVYFTHTISSLIVQLAATGFDCRDAHFQLDKQRGYINLAVYKTSVTPDYTRNLYDLKDTGRLPASLDDIIESKGFFEETDLVLQWLDRSVQILAV
jgi:SAM-dependent methyltransferase